MTIKDSWVSKGATGCCNGLKKVPCGVWNFLSTAAAGLGAGAYSLASRADLGQIFAGATTDPAGVLSHLGGAITPPDVLHTAGGALASYVGLKDRNLIDMLIPAVILGADNLYTKATDAGYTLGQLGSDLQPELLGAGALYFLGLGLGKLINKPSAPKVTEESH